jgi:hypothetical protein
MSSLLERSLHCCYKIGNLTKVKRIQEIPSVSPLEDSFTHDTLFFLSPADCFLLYHPKWLISMNLMNNR